MTSSNLVLFVPSADAQQDHALPRLNIDSLACDWFDWLTIYNTKCLVDDSSRIVLPELPPEIADSFPPQNSGGLILCDGEKLKPNLLIATDIWCHVSRTYFRATSDRHGYWVWEETEIADAKALFSACEFATAVIAKYSLTITPMDLARSLMKTAKAKASPIHRAEENNWDMWVRSNLVGFDHKMDNNPARRMRATQWLTSTEICNAFISDQPTPLSGRSLEMKLSDAIRLVFDKQIQASDVAKKKNVWAGKRGWIGIYWAAESVHYRSRHQDSEK